MAILENASPRSYTLNGTVAGVQFSVTIPFSVGDGASKVNGVAEVPDELMEQLKSWLSDPIKSGDLIVAKSTATEESQPKDKGRR